MKIKPSISLALISIFCFSYIASTSISEAYPNYDCVFSVHGCQIKNTRGRRIIKVEGCASVREMYHYDVAAKRAHLACQRLNGEYEYVPEYEREAYSLQSCSDRPRICPRSR